MSKRECLPARRPGWVQKARVGGQKLYLIVGEYPDGRPGEVFIIAAKTGHLVDALLSNFAISVSLGLQHGVPLEEFVDAFERTRFDPAGPVSGSAEVKMASSILDYVFRELKARYVPEPAAEPKTVVDVPVGKVAGVYSKGSGV